MMEMLQTIWSSLTTENAGLTNTLIMPLSFLEAYIVMLIFTTTLNVIVTKRQKIQYVLFIAILGILTNIFIPEPYNTYVNVVIFLFANFFILKATVLKSIFGFVIPFSITIILELLLAYIYNIISTNDYSSSVNIPINRILFSLIIYAIEYIFYVVLKKFKRVSLKIDIMNKKTKVLLSLSNILAILLIASQLYILTFYSSNMPFFITLLSIIGLITYFSINLYNILTVSKLERTSMNLEEAKLYNKTLEILQDNTKAFRHDFSNILQGMVGYMDNNDMEGLKQYYSQFVEDIQHSNNLTTLSPKVVNNPAIYNVLASKYHKADSLGIKIHLEAFLDMNELHIKIYEFARVLGILMDNAIEAASECENKIINVVFRNDTRKHMQLLIIENTYQNKDVNTDKIFEKGYSTKKGNTGLGLWEIRQILKKNNNLNLFTSKNDEFFSQQFEIYY